MTQPHFTDYERRTRHTFHALMWALSYPGQSFDLLASGADAIRDIADSLLDLETSFYCEDEALMPILNHTGARHLSSDRAAYHIYPILTDEQLATVKQANIGTLAYPDEGTTLLIGCQLGVGATLTLEGPGINPAETRQIQVQGVPRAFWDLRERAIRYPRGWDVYLIDGASLVGLPRTTRIIIEE